MWAYNDRYNCENPVDRADELPDEDEKYEEIEIFYPPYPFKELQINDDEYGDNDVFSESEDNDDNVSDNRPSDNKDVKLMVAPDEERAFIEGIVLKLLNHISDPLLKAELLREIGRFDEASETLKQVSSDNQFLIRFKQAMADCIHKKETKSIDLTPLMYASR